MSFLDQFDSLEHDKISQTELLRDWLENHTEALFSELREHRPVLRFWSHHPGNADLGEREAGYVLLLTRWLDVKHALENLSMYSYKRRPVKEGSEFILSMSASDAHTKKNAALVHALKDPSLDQKIQQSIHEAWVSFAGYCSPRKGAYLDVHQFARNVALRFTGKFFGIPENLIFGGDDSFEHWSLQGYENFIWKLHGRHFGEAEPDMNRALFKISTLIRGIAYQMMALTDEEKRALGGSSTVISRLFFSTLAEPFSNELDILHNIVGLIQGLVDNVAISISNAFEYIIDPNDPSRLKAAQAAQFHPEKLLNIVHAAHKVRPPSPYLPRFGKPSDLGISDEECRGDANIDHYISCAIFPAIQSAEPEDDWDIRLGSGLHKCIGQFIGDKITVATIAQLLKLDNLKAEYPVVRRWGWLIESFRIKSNRFRNYAAVQLYTNVTRHRPNPYSTWSEKPHSDDLEQANYVSWPSLTDRKFFDRHLNCSEEQGSDETKNKKIDELFLRTEYKASSDTSSLFSFFAQWLTDSFMRTDFEDRRKNLSNHQIDMCQLYGMDEETTSALRSHQHGKLVSDIVKDKNGIEHEVLPFLYDFSGKKRKIKKQFKDIPYVRNKKYKEFIHRAGHPDRSKKTYFASGLPGGNSHVGYTALSCLFLREHNRICDELIKNEAGIGVDDERIFQTTRLIVIALEIKIIIEEYINHIASPAQGGKPFVFDASFAEYQNWYRTNWVSLEFNLLYRWHCLMPDQLNLRDKSYSYNTELKDNELLVDNKLVIEQGIEAILGSASQQAAAAVGLFNTPRFLFQADKNSLEMARKLRVRPYNDYRECFGLPRLNKLEQLTQNPETLQKLNDIYDGKIDDVDFLVGLYAEDKQPDKIFGSLMTRMVAYDAFTHALTNPILSNNVWNEQTFTETGMKIISETHSLDDLMKRNSGLAPCDIPDLSFALKT